MSDYPSLKKRQLLKVLKSIGYVVDRQKGSHMTLVCEGRQKLTFAFHDGQSIPPGLVKKILTKDVGLSDKEAIGVLSG